MATAILQSHYCPQNRHREDRFHLTPANPNPISKSNATISSGRRKRSPTARTSRASVTNPSPAKDLVMGQVKILKRGEKVDLNHLMIKSKKKVDGKDNNTDLVLCSTDRLGPDPKVVGKQIKVFPELYAGSVSLVTPSPPPSSLPFPTALVRGCTSTSDLRNGTATSDLRKMLRI